MIHLSDFESLLWLASTLINGALLAIMFLKQRIRGLPFFAAFVAGSLIRTIALYFILRHRSKYDYLYAYWGFAAFVDVGLQLGLIYEVGAVSFRNSGKWSSDTRKPLLGVVLGGVATGLVVTALKTSSDPNPLAFVVIKGTLFTAILMAEMFAGMLILSVALGLPWKRPASRIALSLGAYSALDVLIEAAHDLFGRSYSRFNSYDMLLFNVRAVSYVCCQIYWIYLLWPDTLPTPQPEALKAAEKWASIIASKRHEPNS